MVTEKAFKMLYLKSILKAFAVAGNHTAFCYSLDSFIFSMKYFAINIVPALIRKTG